MASYYFYIIYSKELDKFYLGHTNNPEGRLRRHNTNHSGFTGKASDWELVYIEEFSTKSEAYKRERQVKAWKSRVRILEMIGKYNSNESPD